MEYVENDSDWFECSTVLWGIQGNGEIIFLDARVLMKKSFNLAQDY